MAALKVFILVIFAFSETFDYFILMVLIIILGINPQDLRGSKTGVFIGVCASESHEFWTRTLANVNGYGVTGNARTMLANRISFSFDFKGEIMHA